VDSVDKSIHDYQTLLREMATQLPLSDIRRVVDLLLSAQAEGKTIYVLGNGGSAANASHLAADLAKTTIADGAPRLRVVALTDSVPLITAWANDTSYDKIFAEQVANLVQSGDVVIAISGSGKSLNVVRAIEAAAQAGAHTVAFTGFDGGHLRSLSQISIHIPCHDYGVVEDLHSSIGHAITMAIKAANGRKSL